MRAFLLLTATVLVAIGIGVAIESTASSTLPPVVAQALTKTMAVTSAEVTQTYPLAPNRVEEGTGIYNAPDRWQGAFCYVCGNAVQTRAVVIGDKEFVVATGGGVGIEQFLKLHQPIAHLHDVNGATPAQQMAFPAIVDARFGTGFRELSGVWTFALSLGTTNARVTGGTLRISGGFVNRASISETQNGQTISIVYSFFHLNNAPRIVVPKIAIVPR